MLTEKYSKQAAIDIFKALKHCNAIAEDTVCITAGSTELIYNINDVIDEAHRCHPECFDEFIKTIIRKTLAQDIADLIRIQRSIV